MNKTKHKVHLFLLSVLILSVACDDLKDKDIEHELPTVEMETTDFLVLSEGLFNMNNSTLARYRFDGKMLETDFFGKINRRGLGDTANDMALYGSKLYVVVNVSSQVEVLDAKTGISLKQIPFFDDKGVARQPRYLTFHDGKAYVCSFDGTVAKIDTTKLTIEGIIKAGKNPDGICITNNKLYVSNSGGLDNPNYDSTVSVIDPIYLKELKKITVGINPYKIHADSEGDVYVVTRGNYTSVPYKLVRIDSKTDKVVETREDIQSLNFTIVNDKAYIYNFNFFTNTSWIKVFDCKSGKIINDNFISDGTIINTPYGIDVNPVNGDIYITDAYSFTTLGDLLCFSSDGKLKFRINEIGLNPNKTVFVNRIK